MSTPIRVLALHAHPDDVEFQCAGTLALLREAGCDVTIATMTPGDCGSAEHDCEAIAAIRRAEAKASASLVGAEYLCLEFRDLAIFNDDDSRRRVTEALRRTRRAGDASAAAVRVDFVDLQLQRLGLADLCLRLLRFRPRPGCVHRESALQALDLRKRILVCALTTC
jgi:hypothetical protein